MKKVTLRTLGLLLVVFLWAALTAAAWFVPAKDTSEAERRP